MHIKLHEDAHQLGGLRKFCHSTVLYKRLRTFQHRELLKAYVHIHQSRPYKICLQHMLSGYVNGQ